MSELIEEADESKKTLYASSLRERKIVIKHIHFVGNFSQIMVNRFFLLFKLISREEKVTGGRLRANLNFGYKTDVRCGVLIVNKNLHVQ